MADSPKEAETAQGLFCAIVDETGKPIPVQKDGITPEFEDFASYYSSNKELVRRVFNSFRFANYNPGIPLEKDTWVAIDSKRGIYKINTADAKASGSKVTVGVSRTQGVNEQSDGY